MVASLRVFFVGGLTSYRALFTWLSPWVAIPCFIVEPLAQIMLFVYIGRSAHVGNDAFFLIGNAIQAVAAPSMFAIGNSIAGERWTGTLTLLLASPAPRIPLFVGRALAPILNGVVVSAFGLISGALLLGVALPASSWIGLGLAIVAAAFGCTGLGLALGAIGLRVRETAVLVNIMFATMLLLSGANIPISALPGPLGRFSPWLPLTHAIQAARGAVAGQGLAEIGPLLGAEFAVGSLYILVALGLLGFFERQARQRATLESR